MKYIDNLNNAGLDENYKITKSANLHETIDEINKNKDNVWVNLKAALSIPDNCFSLIKDEVLKTDLQNLSKNSSNMNSSLKYAYFFYKYSNIDIIELNSLSKQIDSITMGLFIYYLRCSVLHNQEVIINNHLSKNDKNFKSLSYFETSLQELLNGSNNILNRNTINSKLDYITKHRIKETTELLNLNFRASFLKSNTTLILREKEQDVFHINIYNLINLIVDAAEKFIESKDIKEDSIEQDIESPIPVILNNSHSTLNNSILQ